MATKKITLGARPSTADKMPQSLDAWVEHRNPESVATKRLTLDISVELHKKIKATCAMRDVKMVNEITKLLEKEFA